MHSLREFQSIIDPFLANCFLQKVAQEMVGAVFTMATRNDFEGANTEKLEKMMKTLIQRWLRQNDTEDDVGLLK